MQFVPLQACGISAKLRGKEREGTLVYDDIDSTLA
jgi:hypothetical protein